MQGPDELLSSANVIERDAAEHAPPRISNLSSFALWRHQGTPLPTVVVTVVVPPNKVEQAAPPALVIEAALIVPLMLVPLFSFNSPVMLAVEHSISTVPPGLVILLMVSDVPWILAPLASLPHTPLAVSPSSGEAAATAGSAKAERAAMNIETDLLFIRASLPKRGQSRLAAALAPDLTALTPSCYRM